MAAIAEHCPSLPTHTRHFYINIVLLNKDEVIAQKVTKKTGGGLIGKAASMAANRVVTDESIMTKLSDTLMEKVTSAVAEMGITANLTRSFRQGPYVVIKVQVTEFDKLSLLLAAKGESYASTFSSLLVNLQELGLEASAIPKIDEKIYDQINEGMMSKFGEVIPSKMAEADVMVDCHVSTPADQADFFYEKLSQINSLSTAGKGK